MSGSDADAVLFAHTGRSTRTDALAWIAEARPWKMPPSHPLLQVLLSDEFTDIARAAEALRRVSRELLLTDIDTSVSLFAKGDILTPEECDAIVAALVAHSPTGTLSGVGPAALVSVLDTHPQTVLVYLQIAGISWNEARRRSRVSLPSQHDGLWRSPQLREIVALVHGAITDGKRPPIENLHTPSDEAWATADRAAVHGVSYGTLIAQRIGGGSWIAHQTRTANAARRHVTEAIATALDAHGLHYATTLSGHTHALTRRRLSRLAARPGAAVGQLSFVVRDDHAEPVAAILVAVAQDGGTARKTGATLLRTPTRLKVPAYLVVAGPGWAERSESDDLIRAFNGNVFTDTTIPLLASTLADRNEP